MDILVSIIFIAAGLGLLVAGKPIATIIARSNAAAFGGGLTGGRGYITYGRVVLGLLGAGFVLLGGGFLIGAFNLE